MTREELKKKGVYYLIENLGYFEALDFLDKIIAGAIEYAKTHHFE